MAGEGHGIDPKVGLCSGCTHASRKQSAKGSVFWRCLAADRDARLLRYPPLPVEQCPVFEERPA
jgi:hypothetical protein